MNVLTIDRTNVLEVITVFDHTTKEIKDILINNFLKPRLLGNVYAAKIISIVDGMDGAFVDIGETENAFIQRTSLLRALGISPSKVASEPLVKLVKKGQMFIGQVDKEPYQTKGAQLTHDVSIAGEFLVLKPFLKGVKVSRKTGFNVETEALENALNHALGRKYGAIVRSATFIGAISPEVVIQELNQLIAKWEELQKKFELMSKAKCIYHNNSIDASLLSMIQTHDVNQFFVSSVEDQMRLLSIGIAKNRIQLKKASTSLSREMGVDLDQFLRAVKFTSKDGISVTINELEAFTVVDINSSKYVMDRNKRNRVFEVNDQAATIILNNILLFNISGVILIDFIDMSKEEQNAFVQHLLDKGFNKKNGITIEGFTMLGILEMTRKRVSPSLRDLLSFSFEEKDLKYWELYLLNIELNRIENHTNTTEVVVELETSMYTFLRQNNLFNALRLKIVLKHNDSPQKKYKLHTSKH